MLTGDYNRAHASVSLAVIETRSPQQQKGPQLVAGGPDYIQMLYRLLCSGECGGQPGAAAGFLAAHSGGSTPSLFIRRYADRARFAKQATACPAQKEMAPGFEGQTESSFGWVTGSNYWRFGMWLRSSRHGPTRLARSYKRTPHNYGLTCVLERI